MEGQHADPQRHGEAAFAPSPKTPGKRSNALKTPPLQRQSHAGARELMRTSAVQDHLAIAGDLGSFVVRFVLFKPTRIDANGSRNALAVPRMTPAALQINNENLFPHVQPLFELFWCDPRQSKFAHETMPPNKLAADVDTEPTESNDRQKPSHSGSVGNRTIQVLAEDVSESGISA